MQSSRRLLLQFRAALIVMCVVACLRAVVAQSSAQLPPPWHDAVSQLADTIAAKLSPLRPLSLETKNISDLSPTEAASVSAALESELKNRSFHLADSDSSVSEPTSKMLFTISQSVEGYVLIAETHSGGESDSDTQTAIVAAPKSPPGTDRQTDESLSLNKRLIWQQPTKFLDFALRSGLPEFYSALAILEPEKLVSYRSSNSEWQREQSVPIAHSKPWPRDLQGQIDVESKIVTLPGVQCVGDVFTVEQVKCAASPRVLNGAQVLVHTPGREGTFHAELFARCGSGSVVLASGTGDWTLPDSIQGYLYKQTRQPAISSGAAIGFDGPVMALWREGRESSARAIILNLNTHNYEGYLVTATCSY